MTGEPLNGQTELLLVYPVDRLSRSVRGLAQILEELDAAGVAFRSATEPFDTASPAGRRDLATVAQQPEPRPQPVAREPEPRCPASTGLARTTCPGDTAGPLSEKSESGLRQVDDVLVSGARFRTDGPTPDETTARQEALTDKGPGRRLWPQRPLGAVHQDRRGVAESHLA